MITKVSLSYVYAPHKQARIRAFLAKEAMEGGAPQLAVEKLLLP